MSDPASSSKSKAAKPASKAPARYESGFLEKVVPPADLEKLSPYLRKRLAEAAAELGDMTPEELAALVAPPKP